MDIKKTQNKLFVIEIIYYVIICVVLISICAKGQDLSALDSYKSQRYTDSVQAYTDSVYNDSVKVAAKYIKKETDIAQKKVVIFDRRVDSLQYIIDTINRRLYKGRPFKQVKERDYNISDKVKYVDFLIANKITDTSTCVEWLVGYLSTLSLTYDILYIVMTAQHGNTRASIHIHRQAVLRDMGTVTKKIKSLSNVD